MPQVLQADEGLVVEGEGDGGSVGSDAQRLQVREAHEGAGRDRFQLAVLYSQGSERMKIYRMILSLFFINILHRNKKLNHVIALKL